MLIQKLKPEHKTHLSRDRLVSKRNGRIAFRGMIDTLEAEFIEAQVLAEGLGENYYFVCFGEVVEFLKMIMAAEVLERAFAGSALSSFKLFGLSLCELHFQSHDVPKYFNMKHPLPGPGTGRLASRINYLRTRVREGELLAVKVFGGFTGQRRDIIFAMNRLSSALWWLFCKCASE